MLINTDVVIIGSGISSLQAARILSEKYEVHIITKAEIYKSSSYKAQGGIAAVTTDDDSITSHVEDTIIAGDYHHNTKNVKTLVEKGKETIQQLINEQFPIDRGKDGSILIGREGAHSMPRIVHSGGDATGKALVQFLLSKLPSNITIHEHEMAFELLKNTEDECIGVKTKVNGEVNTYLASYVILATGGVGAVYGCTSNWENNFGDGIALAYLAGAQITDMEFVQFHPSLLYVNGKACGLVSEAVRGAGGYFMKENGERLMKGIHPLEDLAPRHITAFEVYKERSLGHEVYINISAIENFEEKFPTITKLCEENGISIAEGKIPIAPGSHFLMGGIIADALGQTSIPRLLAIGEVACTGVHGANRLASNSLLEGVTFGRMMAENLLTNGTFQTNFQIKNTKIEALHFSLVGKIQLQKNMLENAFVLRNAKALQKLCALLPKIDEIYQVDLSSYNRDEIELYFINIVCSLIVNAALTREESRGSHIRIDYPIAKEEWQNKWIVYEKGTMNVRNELYEQYQVNRDVETVLQ